MQLRTRVLANNVVLTGLLLVAGGTSLHVHGTLAEGQRFLSGPAASTTRDAHEIERAIADQLLAVEMLLNGAEVRAMRTRIDAAVTRTEECLTRIGDAGICSPAATSSLRHEASQFQSALAALLTAHEQRLASKHALDEHTVTFNELSTLLEEVGDGAVEVLEKQPDKPMAWAQGLKDIWEAADGGMENRIGLLAQYLALGDIETAPTPAAMAALDAALEEQKSAATRMLTTPTFDGPAPAKWGSISMRDLYTREFATHEQRIRAYAAQVQALPAQRAAYTAKAQALDGAAAAVAAATSRAIETRTTAALDAAVAARTTMLSAIVVAVLLAVALGWHLARSLQSRLSALRHRMREIAEGDGDLTKRLRMSGDDEIATTAASCDRFLERIDRAISDMNVATNQVDAVTLDLTASANNLSNSSSQQAGALQEVSATMIEISARSTAAAEHAAAAGSHSQEATAAARQGAERTQQLTEAVAQIRESSDAVAKVIRVIEDIAFQTNLLALNAAVEAARAGEAGKGFAVVAEEVRNLASRSAEAAKNTSQLLATASERSQRGCTLAADVDQSLQAIVHSYAKVEEVLASIHSSTTDQKVGIDQVTKSLSQIDQGTQHNAATAEEVARSATTSTEQVRRMRDLVGSFKVSATAATNRTS